MFINNLGQVFLGAPGEPSDLGNSAPNPPFGSRHLYPREGAGWAEGSVGTWGPPHSHPNLAPTPKPCPTLRLSVAASQSWESPLEGTWASGGIQSQTFSWSPMCRPAKRSFSLGRPSGTDLTPALPVPRSLP